MAASINPQHSMPEIGYVRQSPLIPAIFPFSQATLWRKVKAGTFPQPVKLGPRITAWKVEDIRDWIEHLGR
jgi:predicted DNA-binding transcriptional regulator AlpA